jgi:hypothetical protein
MLEIPAFRGGKYFLYCAVRRSTEVIELKYSYYLIVIPLVIGLAQGFDNYQRDTRADSREQRVSGRVLAHTDSHGNGYSYSYAVNGVTRYNVSGSPQLAPSGNALPNGSPIIVFYDGENPDRSSLIHFSEEAEKDFAPIPATLLAIMVVLVGVSVRRVREALGWEKRTSVGASENS